MLDISNISISKSITRIILWILVFSPNFIFSQETSLDFKRFTIDNGISNNSINSILQTSDGFLWIATKDGLNRFDGNSFRIYKHSFIDSTSLPQNYVMSLFEDHDKNLWVGSWGGGLSKYNPICDNFESFDHNGKRDDYIQCLYQDNNNYIWFGTLDGGLFKLDNEKNILINYSNLENKDFYIPSNNITCITQLDSFFLIGTWDQGLLKLNEKNRKYSKYLLNEKISDSEISNLVWDIFKKKDDELLLATGNGVQELNISTNKRKKILEGNIIRKILKDDRGRIWIGTYDYKGIFMFEDGDLNNNFYLLQHADNNPKTITGNRIRGIYEDRLKNIWFATEDGLNKLPKIKEFKQYRYFPTDKSILSNRVVSSIYEGKNNILWVGYGGGGFDKIDLESGKKEHYNHDADNSNSLSASDVITLMEDSDGILWIGTSIGGLNRFDPEKKIFKRYLQDENKSETIKSNWVHQIIELDESNLLIGTNESLEIFEKETEKFNYYSPELSSHSIKLPEHLSVNALLKDSKNNIWIGTWLNGIYFYNKAEKFLYHFEPQRGIINSISSNKITSFLEDSKNRIWVGTHSGGLNVFESESMSFKNYNTQNGMPNDVIFGILEDKEKFIWISTMKGLVKLNPETENFRIYDESDGLISNQFNWHSYYKNKEGKLYFGGIGGLISFFPKDIASEPKTQEVKFLTFIVNGKELMNSYSLSDGKLIELEHYENFFTVDYTVLDFSPLEKHNYQYKLEGIDKNWNNAGTKNYAFYTDIHPGEYKLLVKASNPDGVWSKVSNLIIVIHPPWWGTWWFRIGLFFLIGAIGLFIYRVRVKQLLEIERIRLNISRDLHDEIGSNLSNISVESQLLLSSTNLDYVEKSQLLHIKKVTVDTIQAMRDIIWFINPQNEIEKDFLLKLRETASQLLIDINWEFNSPQKINFEKVKLDTKRNIFLIYKEILNNIITHSQAKNCKINIKSTLNLLMLEISDDGIGFDINNLKRINGLVNIEGRAKKINAEIQINSVVGKGTSISLIIYK